MSSVLTTVEKATLKMHRSGRRGKGEEERERTWRRKRRKQEAEGERKGEEWRLGRCAIKMMAVSN